MATSRDSFFLKIVYLVEQAQTAEGFHRLFPYPPEEPYKSFSEDQMLQIVKKLSLRIIKNAEELRFVVRGLSHLNLQHFQGCCRVLFENLRTEYGQEWLEGLGWNFQSFVAILTVLRRPQEAHKVDKLLVGGFTECLMLLGETEATQAAKLQSMIRSGEQLMAVCRPVKNSQAITALFNLLGQRKSQELLQKLSDIKAFIKYVPEDGMPRFIDLLDQRLLKQCIPNIYRFVEILQLHGTENEQIQFRVKALPSLGFSLSIIIDILIANRFSGIAQIDSRSSILGAKLSL